MKKITYLFILISLKTFVLFGQNNSDILKFKFNVCIVDENNVPTIEYENEEEVILNHSNIQLKALFDSYVIYSFEKTYLSNENERYRTTYTFVCEDIQLMYDLETDFSTIFQGFREIQESHTLSSLNSYPLPNDYSLERPQDYLDIIKAPKAWSFTSGNSNVKLGITDSGYRTYIGTLLHEELEFNTIFLNSTSIHYHGSRVASIMAGSTNNGKGLASIGRDCSIIGSTSMSVSGLVNLSTSYPDIKVINGSWYSSCYYYQTQQDDINNLNKDSVSLVFAAGNGFNGGSYTCGQSTSKIYPACYDNVISVSCVNSTDITITNSERSVGDERNIIDGHDHFHFGSTTSDTNHHNYDVDIVVPAYVMTFAEPWAYNSYGIRDSGGTSYAAPVVSGTIGLMLSANYSLTPKERETILKLSAKNIDYITNAHNPIHNDSLSDYAIANRPYKDMLGAGRLDAGKAVEMAYRMQQTQDTLKINNRDFYRDWEFEIKNSPYAIEIENETFRDSIKVDFTARKNIKILAGTFLSPDTGVIKLRVDDSMPLAILPPTTSSNARQALEDISLALVDLKENITVSPNPTSSIININISEEISIYKIHVYNVQNKKIMTVVNNFESISLSNLQSGLYIFKIETSDGIFIKKVIKE